MNVPVFNGATTVTPAAQRSEAPRPQSASHEPVFTVPMEPPAEPVAQQKVQPHRNDRQPAPRKARSSRDDEPVKARRDDDDQDRDDRDDDRPRATDERSAQLSAWMLQMLTPGATGLAVASTGVDITDPAARFADPTEGLQAQQNPAEGAALGRELAVDLGDDVHHVAVALDDHQVTDGHAAILADSTNIVTG